MALPSRCERQQGCALGRRNDLLLREPPIGGAWREAPRSCGTALSGAAAECRGAEAGTRRGGPRGRDCGSGSCRRGGAVRAGPGRSGAVAAQSGPGAGGGSSGAMAADVFMRPAQLLGAAGPLSPRTEPDEDSSDTDDGGASPGGGRRCGPRRGQPPGPQIIHSGHFMVSSPHSEHPPKKGYDFDTVNEQTCQTYQFGAARGGGGAGGRLSIDASLTKLFECMSLAYRYRAPGLVSQRRGESPEGAGRGAGPEGAGPGQRRGRAGPSGAA